MSEIICPICGSELYDHRKYLYCYRCSKQFKRGIFGGLKEVRNTLLSDQRKAMGR